MKIGQLTLDEYTRILKAMEDESYKRHPEYLKPGWRDPMPDPRTAVRHIAYQLAMFRCEDDPEARYDPDVGPLIIDRIRAEEVAAAISLPADWDPYS